MSITASSEQKLATVLNQKSGSAKRAFGSRHLAYDLVILASIEHTWMTFLCHYVEMVLIDLARNQI